MKRKNKFAKGAAASAVVMSSTDMCKHNICNNICNYEIVAQDKRCKIEEFTKSHNKTSYTLQHFLLRYTNSQTVLNVICI